jgi:hypothetical protein
MLDPVAGSETTAEPAPALPSPQGRANTVRAWIVSPRALEVGILLTLFGVALGVRIWLNGRILAPWIYGDEITYSDLAEDFVENGLVDGIRESLRILGAIGYPLVIAPAWLADDIPSAYTIAKGINTGLMTLAVFVVYLIARRLMRWQWALVAAVLSLALPFFLYSSALMSENGFFIVFALAVLALVYALERPTLLRQFLVIVAVAAAMVTRVQGFVVAGIALTSVLLVVLYNALDNREEGLLRGVARGLWRFKVWIFAAPIAAVAYIAVKLAQGAELGSAFGVYNATTRIGDYTVRDSGRWILASFGELALAVGLVPVATLIILFGISWSRERLLDTRQRIFVFVTASAFVWLVVQVGIFSSRFAFDLIPQERSMAYVMPLLLVGTVLWLERGMPRPPALAVAAVAIPAVAVVALPLERMLPVSGNHALGLFSIYVVQLRLPATSDEIRALVAIGLALAAIAIALPRRFARPVVPVALLVFAVVSSFLVFAETRKSATNQRFAPGIGLEANWIDNRAGTDADVQLIYTSSQTGLLQLIQFLETDFWNKSIRGIDSLDSDQYFGATLQFDPLTGFLARTDPNAPASTAPFAVATADLGLAGDVVDTVHPFVLYRVERPLRVASTIDGLWPDGWAGPVTVYSRYATPGDAPVTLDLSLSRAGWGGTPIEGDVVVRVGPMVAGADGAPGMGEPVAEYTRDLTSGEAQVLSVPTPPPPFRVEIFSPTFSPAQFGQPDTRQLGVRLGIAARAPQ